MDIASELLSQSGFANLTGGNIVMFLVAAVLIYLAITKGYEPLLLIPIAFGAILANLPLANMASTGEGILVIIYEAGIKTELDGCEHRRMSRVARALCRTAIYSMFGSGQNYFFVTSNRDRSQWVLWIHWEDGESYGHFTTQAGWLDAVRPVGASEEVRTTSRLLTTAVPGPMTEKSDAIPK